MQENDGYSNPISRPVKLDRPHDPPKLTRLCNSTGLVIFCTGTGFKRKIAETINHALGFVEKD